MEPRNWSWFTPRPPSSRSKYAEEGRLLAKGDNLERGANLPMTELRLTEGRVLRKDRWPNDLDQERPVILPGGEVGILKSSLPGRLTVPERGQPVSVQVEADVVDPERSHPPQSREV